MFILGLQGSPRKGGNTDTLLATFLEKAAEAGANVHTLQVPWAKIEPCRGCGYCETHGRCVIAKDPMSTEIYGLMRKADVIVAASPVFFYGISAQLKGLIDRSQALWSRKYVYKLKDPKAGTRKGVLLSVGASKGRQLFEGINLTAKYFFDAVDARFEHALTYRGVESKGAILHQANLFADIDDIVGKIIVPLVRRKRILFVSANGACLAPMAAAIAQARYGDRIDADFAAHSPSTEFSEQMVQTMEKSGIDVRYGKPKAMDQAILDPAPDLTVTMGEPFDHENIPGLQKVHWHVSQPAVSDEDAMAQLHRQLSERVDKMVQTFP